MIRGTWLVLESKHVSPGQMLEWIGPKKPGSWLEQLALALEAYDKPEILDHVAAERRAVAEDFLASLRGRTE